MKKLLWIFALFICLFAGCGQDTDTQQTPVKKPSELTLEERKDIFASYFNYSQLYKPSDIKDDLNTVENLKVLTLDEALSVFWQESGLAPKDYLYKTDTSGQVYYSHKIQDNEITVYVNLLYQQTGEDDTKPSPEEYGFIVMQTDGADYLININGTVTQIE